MFSSWLLSLSVVVCALASFESQAPPNAPLPWGAASCFVHSTWAPSEVERTDNLQYGFAYNNCSKKNETLLLDVYLPPAYDTRKARPAVVLIHGGAFISGSKDNPSSRYNYMPELASILAQRGYVVVSIDYRLATVLCAMHQPVALADPVVMASEDARAAVRFLRSMADQWRVDTSRIAVGGGSAGAIAALYYAYKKHAPEGTSGNPEYSSSINAVFAMSGSLTGPYLCHKLDPHRHATDCIYTRPPMVDNTDELTQDDIPYLAFHGTKDTVVPYLGALQLDERAKAKGVSHLLLTVHGDGHMPFPSLINRSANYLTPALNFLSGALNLAAAECPQRVAEVLV